MILIEVSNLDKEIEELYSTDEEFINNFNIQNPTLESCISHAKEVSKLAQEHYIIQKDGKLVAFFGKQTLESQEFIVPFFIAKEFRHNKNDILVLIESKFSKPRIILSLGNKKAVKFFIFNNFSMIDIIENDGSKRFNSIILGKR